MSRRYNSDNEEEDSFEKEYLNIFKNDFLDEDDADDDYNVVEDILNHKYNYDEKPYYLSIPKKEVNDVINDANLQDNLEIFSDKENEYRFLSRKTNRNKENKNNINANKQPSNLSNNEQISAIDNNSNHNITINNFNKQNMNLSGISNIKQKTDNNGNINSKIKSNNKSNGNNNIKQKEETKNKKSNNNESNKNKHIKNNNHFNTNFNIISNPLSGNNLNLGNNFNNQYNSNPQNNNNNIIVNSSNNNYNDMKYDYFSKMRDINQNKGLNQMDLIEKLLFLLKQYDFLLQLLIQNLMMTENKNLKFRCYTLLFSFYMAKQRVIENLRFPEFHVGFEFNEIFGEGNNSNYINNNMNYNNKYQRLRLQLSFFQPPILEILPILVKFIIKRTFTREETIKILKDFFPFTNPLYFPISKKFRHSTYIPTINTNMNNNANINTDNNNLNNNNNENQNSGKKKMRKKFNYIDDSLLLLGIYFHGKKNYEIIKQLWLPQRSNEEIKHRIKNLVCQNAPLNIIKKFKTMNENPLNQKDFLKFLKGIEWFGLKNKWNLISRYFLPERTSDYLENFFELLIEKNVLPSELSTNNNKSNGMKYKNGNFKKVHIFMDDDVVKMYKENYKDQISLIKSEITNMNNKNHFYSDVEYEKLDKEYFTRNKDDTRINTRNKSKKALNANNNINEGGNNNNDKGTGNNISDDKKNANSNEVKNNGTKNNSKDNSNSISNEEWEFKMNFLDNELFEKITI